MCARIGQAPTRFDVERTLQDIRPVSFASIRKHRYASTRIASSTTAWARAREAMSVIGITRLADITGLDTTGLPTWSAVRPLADRFSVSVTCGKGLRSIDARIGAVMEAVEYWSAEPTATHVCCARMDELDGPAVDPQRLALPAWSRAGAADRLAWCGGWDVVRHAPVWVPANAVYFPFEQQPGRFLFTPTTNGLAAGLAIEEAACHALAELIERDAWSLVCARVWTGEPLDHRPTLALESVPRAARSILEGFACAGIDVTVRVITSDIGVPTFHAMSVEPGGGKTRVHEGMGAHPDAEVALGRALTELAQSRAADIQGSREDLTYWRARATENAHAARGDPDRPRSVVSFASVPTFVSRDVRDDIDWMLARLQQVGLDEVIVVDLTSPRLRLPVVRVVVPGLEVTCVDPWRAGRRVDAARASESEPAGMGGA
jgi:ribosomal protein S12 methylthiotransferase accessory factor